jgi:translation initiation factor IF-3
MNMKPRQDNLPLINEKIRFERLQLITHDGRNLGVVTRDQALREARSAGLDLVIISEQGGDGFPVAKVMDFGKVLYEKKKQQAEAKKKQHVIQVKELKLRPKIAEHDFETKMNQAMQFLKEGKRLKITLMFKGRESAMRDERGSEMFAKIEEIVNNEGFGPKLLQEKDTKAPTMWSRIYFLKK